MTDHTLITTLYTLEPVLICVTRLSPSKIIILTEEDTAEKKAQAEQILEATFGKVIEIKKAVTSLYDPVRVAQDVAALIEKEHAQGRKVQINVSGGRKPQAFGALFGAYARSDMVARIVYVTEEDNFIIDFPVLSFNISPTKKMILELVQNGTVAVESIAMSVGISKGMAYNHLRELKSMGYITDGDGYKITDSGRLAVI
ncbi:CRISPR locus-related DNA-binding protein (plasmid) [Methanomethylovorans hollandica DSM 15978]|jgi:CRISPR-associated protein Csa3|uniref:CRISPR locus-related DNA-binding protein n=1 Tax=Methanomethylovorans hollandica (strain DSM 15978 / NBRC 107637 / DMS1) TaxID=867904 RepID=L0KZ53_METHD|nr:CRISPR-associated CARF protein Csa3 [Methanomethylovorans hollandica]AGB50732.1 CRISPR locus-related DNA-binding protein [Methanomethylovorans hollandica DSM 15978]